jgi:hypothetical protein
MKMTFYDVLFILILQNLEYASPSNSERKELMGLATDILPDAKCISQKLEDYYTNMFNTYINAIDLLEPEDDTLVKIDLKYPSSYLTSSNWYNEKYYNTHKNSLCHPNSIQLKTYTYTFAESNEEEFR